MNRISRRSAEESAEALLEVGRTEPVLNYDVELGLARHHDWLRSEASMPEWADASVGNAAKSLLPVVIKTLVSAVLVGALAVAAWQMRGRPQPSAAQVKQRAPATKPAPSIEDVGPADSEARLARTPIPVSDQRLPSEPRVRRAVRIEVPDKHATHFQRTHRESASARAASVRAELADVSSARVERAAPATSQPIEDMNVEHAASHEVAAEPARKTISAEHARPEPGSEAQQPDDLIEMQQVAAAEQLLERSPARALALVREGDQRFAHGYFQQERAYIAIMGLIRLGQITEARARAASFAKQFPALPYGARIRSALEARDAVPPSAASR